MDLRGKVALVTGANRGLGAAFVEGLVAQGARVVAAARDRSSLAATIDRHGSDVRAIELDVTDADSVRKSAASASDVDILFNNAGILKHRSPGEAGNIDGLRAEMEVNVFGMARMSLAFAPVIAANSGGVGLCGF